MNFYFYPVIIILYLPHELLPIFIHQFPLGSFGPEGRVILPLKSPQHVMTFARKNLLESSEGGECPRPRQTLASNIADLVNIEQPSHLLRSKHNPHLHSPPAWMEQSPC